MVVRLKFLAALVSLALDADDISLGSGFDIRGVRFVGVDVHGQGETRIHANQHVAKDQLAIAGDADADHGLVADAVAAGRPRESCGCGARRK